MIKLRLFITLIISILFCLSPAVSFASPIAFPGAEGAGRFSTGGRGGSVYIVNNLNNSGAGSIVDAVSQGNRTIVFRVSGTIDLGGVILRPKSNTTIAGQTAPGDGICLKGRIIISNNYSNIIIRYIRIRVDSGAPNAEGDAIDIASGNNIIIDHVSASYARDETISCQDGTNNVTVQWCILSEAVTDNHSYGALVRGQYGEQKSYHHNLFIHNRGRNPRPGNYRSAAEDSDGLYFDFRNNVIYNWAGTHPGNNYDTGNISRYNFINNVYIRGPGSSGTRIFGEYSIVSHGFFSGNAHGTSYSTVNVPSDPWNLVTFSGFTTAQITAYKNRTGGVPIPMEPVTTTSAFQALDDVLANAGASLVRDVIDTRLVSEVISGTGSYVAYTSDLADPWPTLNSLTAPPDSDNDGMPDAWEIAKGLDPYNAADRNFYDLHLDYTNLEVYLNSLVEADLEAPAIPTGLTATAGSATVSLDWDDNTESDLAGYNIYRSTISGSGYVKLNSLLLTSSNYTDNAVTNGTTYYYVVTAVDTSYNESDFSNEEPATPGDTTAPEAPVGLWGTFANSMVQLDWNDNTESDFIGYNIYRSVNSNSNYIKLNSSLLNSSDYTDDTVVSSNTYYYVVTAVDESLNESEDSYEISAMFSNTAMGTILREYWTGISGSQISDLTSDENYPDYPSGSDLLVNLEGPSNWADSYGTRIRGYIHPPTTGEYTFYISSDNNSELWLSSDYNPTNALLIASVSGETNTRQWDKYPSQQSSPVSMAAGQKYYIEILHKENSGTDNLAAAWSGPGITQQVIAGQYLSPLFIGLYGDANNDNIVDADDLPYFIEMWLEDNCAASSGWDFNGDCVIDFHEFSLFAANWLDDFMAPDAPVNLSAVPDDASVSLNWDDNSEADLAGYNVYRSTISGSAYIKINGSILGASQYIDNSVTNGITYYYVVTAVDTSLNESPYSNEESATPNAPLTNVIIQENETGFCGVEGIIDTKHAGYTGGGFCDSTNANGAGINWSINIISGGTYTFTWRFANGSTARSAKLIINGSDVLSGINFPATGAWTNWDVLSVDTAVTSGIKTIRLEATNGDGLPNIDYIMISGAALEITACP